VPDDAPGWFGPAFLVALVVVVVLIVGGFVLTIYVAARNARALKRAGVDPFTVQAELVGKLASSELLAPAETMESKLAELDDLRNRGLISAEEHAAARAKALGA
jgi:hypothetical protein